jgi:hypothetical protein
MRAKCWKLMQAACRPNVRKIVAVDAVQIHAKFEHILGP